MAGRGKKPGAPKTGGRKAGTPNVVTASVKAAIVEAFDVIGGVPALASWARKNRSLYYTKVLPRVLPKEITGELGLGVGLQIVEEIVDSGDSPAATHHANGKAEPAAS